MARKRSSGSKRRFQEDGPFEPILPEDMGKDGPDGRTWLRNRKALHRLGDAELFVDSERPTATPEGDLGE